MSVRRLRQSLVVVAASLGAWLAPDVAGAAITVRLQTARSTVVPGDTLMVEFAIPVADSPFNAFHLVLRYDPARVTLLPEGFISGQMGTLMSDACPTLFHQFSSYAESNVDSTVADVSLLCNQTFVTGPGVIYRLRFLAGSTSGAALFSIGASSRFYAAGVYVNPVFSEGLALQIASSLDVPSGPSERGERLEAPRPNPLRPGDSASVAFTLPTRAAAVLELFDLAGRRVARYDAGVVPAGRTLVRWSVPGLSAGHYQLRLSADGRIVARNAWVILR